MLPADCPCGSRPMGHSKKRRGLPSDLNLGRMRTDQGRQHTHHIPQPIVSWPDKTSTSNDETSIDVGENETAGIDETSMQVGTNLTTSNDETSMEVDKNQTYGYPTFLEQLSYRKSTDHQSNIYRKSFEGQSKAYRNSIGNMSSIHRTS